MPVTLTQSEIEERVGILRRFREALLRRRERFSRYLEMLEQQPPGENDSDRIEIYVEIEQAIIQEIAGFEQVIEPLQLMYREHGPDGAADLPHLKADLERTRDEVLLRAVRSRDLLKQEISSLRSEISGLRIMHRRRSLFATAEPTTIDISA
ncbi:MAG: hypothetical protein V3S41_07205 [Spirochaetia bacterium]